MAETDPCTGFFIWTREAQIAIQPDGTVIAWNPAATRMLQIPAAAALGHPISDLVPEMMDLLTTGSVHRPSTAPEWQRRTLTLRDGEELAVEAAVIWHDGLLLLILADISEIVAAERATRSVDQQYRSMLDALPIGFTVVSLRDKRYPTLYQNDWGSEVSGWGNDEWERDPDFTLKILHPDDRERMAAFRDEFQTGFRPFDVEYRVVSPDGDVVWLRDWGTVVHDADGNPDRTVVCLLDITAQKNAEHALRAAITELSVAHDEVQAISRAKSDYLAFVSHEFRTPLTSIQGFSELIASGSLPPDEVLQFAQIVSTNAQRLARMITDLLNMDRLESGRQRVRLRRVQVGSLIEDVLETLDGLGHDHPITLAVADDVPPIQADDDLLTQLFTNLVSNAIKYTPPAGPIAVEITRPDAAWVEIAIADSGPGIPPDALETIFLRFARLARDDRQQIVGSGLGLPIARQIAELHGGRVWAENTLGGARFVVHLPVAGPPPPSG